MSETEKLEPCPFCGSPAILHENDWSEPHQWRVHCTDFKCLASGRTDTRERAIAAWNRRARPSRAAVLEEAAGVAERAHLVPPDGGSPTENERAVAEAAAAAIRALKSKDTDNG